MVINKSTFIHMQRTAKMSLEVKTFMKWANGQNIYDFDKEIDPGVILILPWGCIHVYDHYRKQIYWYISQISGEHLLDHWSSCLCFSLKVVEDLGLVYMR